MNNNIQIVKTLYSEEHAIGDMRDYTKKKLKVWEVFTTNEMIDLALKTGFTVMECKRGMVYTKENGPILYCVCKKNMTSNLMISTLEG